MFFQALSIIHSPSSKGKKMSISVSAFVVVSICSKTRQTLLRNDGYQCSGRPSLTLIYVRIDEWCQEVVLGFSSLAEGKWFEGRNSGLYMRNIEGH
ncbi:hypothetical protein CDAR_421551 [Caerostris darwini]|uniref:Uncharacterized protein n=1 Tax=Caerostris darwini TaxID=1538125 RepID=A0AAV4SXR0_9ARAC|nr:hypothetical protein CDAR_421551 [Caerostris darwini]